MKKIIRSKAAELIATLFGIIGLMMAASDGDWFPWPNLIGLLIVCIITKCTSWSDNSQNRIQHMRRT
jgi:hypothetical protein